MAKFLLAEDSDNLRMVLEMNINDLGHEVLAVPSGSDAWLHLELGEKFDVIISDNNMPGMDGVEVLRRLRTVKGDVKTPFILMSGYVTLPDGQRLEDVCNKYGATFYEKTELPPVGVLIGQLLK